MSLDILQLDADLLHFFNNIEINLYDGDVKIDILYWFPLLKQGFSQAYIIRSLFYLYACSKGLCKDRIIILDEPIKKAMGKHDGVPIIGDIYHLWKAHHGRYK